MDQTIRSIEEADGVRLTWNIWPSTLSKLEAIPMACMYNIHQPALTLPCEPIPCHSCQSILNNLSLVDFGSYSWTCMFCNTKNTLPPHARDISPNNLLPEMMDQNSTVEYILSKNTPFPPVYFLIIDICTYDQERHDLMKRGVLAVLDKIPENALIGVILFGTNIDLLTFNNEEIKTIYKFSGKIQYKKETLANLGDVRNFLVKKSEKFEEIVDIINNLEADPFPVMSGYRQIRCTGSALSFAVSFMEGPFNDSPVKYMLFTQGPCTLGPGKVNMLEIVENSGERLDLEGVKIFYKELGERINSAGHSVDLISETIADIGIEYLKHATALTGGAIVMAQDFDEDIKINTIARLMASENGVLKQGFNAKIQVKTTPNLAFKGIFGEGRPLGSGWRVGSILEETNISILLENTSSAKSQDFGYVQIITQYQRSDRSIATRVTTLSRMFSDDKTALASGFDQEAACVFQARALLSKEFQNVMDFESAIDKSLIKFTKRYGTYERNNPASVFLPDSMSYFPNFMFFFRRSLLVQKDGISQDESAYFKNLVYKLKVSEALKMIKPSLVSFHYQGDVKPVELDVESLDPESILVLDSFHNVLLWKGAYVADWIRNGLHEQEGYEFFKNTIEAAEKYSLDLLNRTPMPQYKETTEGKSQERILLHYVNPSQKGALNTEKIDYSKFHETLCRFIVKGE
jgi:protein transport protein SEC23